MHILLVKTSPKAKPEVIWMEMFTLQTLLSCKAKWQRLWIYIPLYREGVKSWEL